MHTELPIVAALAVFASLPAVALGQPCDPADLFEERVDYAVGTFARSIAMGDLNDDGVADLAVVTGEAADVRILFNNGDGTFAPRVDLALHGLSRGVAIGDLDGDGDGDLVATNAAENSVSVLLGNGDGTFAPYVVYETITRAESVVIGDWNGDGAPDLAVSDAEAFVTLLRNTGDGTFGPPASYETGFGPHAMAVGDLNGDGALDLATANEFSDDLSVLLNGGAGAFVSEVRYRVGDAPTSVAIGDLDGDGDGDLVATSFDDYIVSVLLNNGDGTFAPRVDYATPRAPLWVAVGDLNNDGLPDLATANSQASATNRLSVFPGNGDGTFGPRANYQVGSDPRSLVMGNLNADGALDVATMNSVSNTVSVLLSTCLPDPPAITTQPPFVLLPPGGGVAEFGVVASGNGELFYQWRREGVDLFDGGRVSGAMTPTLTIDATIEDVAAYDVVVTNASGEAISESGVLAVKPNPCPADFDGDGTLTLFDFLAFQNAFARGCP